MENRAGAGRTGSVLLVPEGAPRFQRDGGAIEERGAWGLSSSGGDAVSILFVHANYSSSVTLLEIEGTGTFAPPPPHHPIPPIFLALSVLSAHLPGPFSFLPELDLLPCPRGFLMDPDYAASSDPLSPSLSFSFSLPGLLPLFFFFFSPDAARDLSIVSRRLYEGF